MQVGGSDRQWGALRNHTVNSEEVINLHSTFTDPGALGDLM